jgi:hypothetical protein
VAKNAVQLSDLFVKEMIKDNGLINRFPSEDWKDGEEDFLRRYLKAMVRNDGEN